MLCCWLHYVTFLSHLHSLCVCSTNANLMLKHLNTAIGRLTNRKTVLVCVALLWGKKVKTTIRWKRTHGKANNDVVSVGCLRDLAEVLARVPVSHIKHGALGVICRRAVIETTVERVGIGCIGDHRRPISAGPWCHQEVRAGKCGPRCQSKGTQKRRKSVHSFSRFVSSKKKPLFTFYHFG